MLLRSRGSRPIAKRDLALADARHAGDEREVFLAERAAAHLAREHLVGAVGLRDEQDAGGVAVQPVHDSGPQLAADPGEIPDVVQQRVDERPRRVPRGRMDDEARAACRSRGARRPRRGSTAGSPRPRAPISRGSGTSTVTSSPARTAWDRRAAAPSTRTAPSGDELLDARAREVGAGRRQEEVEPGPGGGEPTWNRRSMRRGLLLGAAAGARGRRACRRRRAPSTRPMHCEVERMPGITKPRTRSPRQISRIPRVIA